MSDGEAIGRAEQWFIGCWLKVGSCGLVMANFLPPMRSSCPPALLDSSTPRLLDSSPPPCSLPALLPVPVSSPSRLFDSSTLPPLHSSPWRNQGYYDKRVQNNYGELGPGVMSLQWRGKSRREGMGEASLGGESEQREAEGKSEAGLPGRAGERGGGRGGEGGEEVARPEGAAVPQRVSMGVLPTQGTDVRLEYSTVRDKI